MNSIRRIVLLCLFLLSTQMQGQDWLQYYLADPGPMDQNIPSPEDVLGYMPGDWHVSHDQLVHYMYQVAAKSDRVEITEYARSHEHRPLLLLTISEPKNLKNIDKIKEQHLANAMGESAKDAMPVVYLGYSIHGNEASGSNAALIALYYLAASQSEEVKSWLSDMVILLDPCFNPDGLHRFSTWVNSHKSVILNPEKENREHNEVWPGGRTNHYWFDLNRDWLLLQHPESRGRIAKFHEWKPNVLTDAHEMGTNATYFFQPGVPSRNNPSTPEETFELTADIAAYHAKALDEIGSLYYSGEGFDDFYAGKGSTYPDLNACVGILFEQASARGHLQESINGPVSLPFAMRNQFTTTLSTLRASHAIKDDLMKHQSGFYQSANNLARNDEKKAYVFGTDKDKGRLYDFVDLLLQHQIEVRALEENFNNDGHSYLPGNAFSVSCKQAQYRLIKEIFETRTEFVDSLFYDVSTWTLPLSYNLNYCGIGRGDLGALRLSDPLDARPEMDIKIGTGDPAVAYAFDWGEFYAPALLNKLNRAGHKMKVAEEPFTAQIRGGERQFARGTVVIIGRQNDAGEKRIEAMAQESNVPIYALTTGLTSSGIDLGSWDFSPVKMPKTLLVVGPGVNAYEAGEVWHLFDQKLAWPITMVEVTKMHKTNLSEYNRIVMVNGSSKEMNVTAASKIKDWIKSGGVLITTKGATKWAVSQDLCQVGMTKVKPPAKDEKNVATQTPTKPNKPSTKPAYYPFGHRGKIQGAQEIGGLIFEAELDMTHPLAYGYSNETIPVFRNHEYRLWPSRDPYSTPLRYTEDPLLSGYISDKHLTNLKGSAAVVVSKVGKGRVISFADNPNFRAFWLGTNKLFINALVFGKDM